MLALYITSFDGILKAIMATDRPTTKPKQPANSEATLPPVPEGEWPGAWGLYKYSRDAIRFNLWTIVFVAAASFGVSLLISIVVSALDLPSIVDTILSNASAAIFGVATVIIMLASVRRITKSFSEAVEGGLNMLAVEMFGLSILQGLIAIGTLILFIIPFFIIYPRFSLAQYYLVDKKMGVIGSLKASWHATKGSLGKLYGIAGVNIAFVLLCLTIVGIPFAAYFLIMYSAAVPVLYSYLLEHAPAAPQPITQAPAPAPTPQQ